MIKKIIFVLLAAALALPALAENAEPASVALFSLPSLNSQTIELKDYLKKDAILLCFFTSWSKACRQEVEFIETLADKYQEQGLKVVGVSFDRKLAELKEYLADSKINFPVAYDKKLTTLKDFKILIIPTLLVIDQEGKIINTYVDFDDNVAKSVGKDLSKLLVP